MIKTTKRILAAMLICLLLPLAALPPLSVKAAAATVLHIPAGTVSRTGIIMKKPSAGKPYYTVSRKKILIGDTSSLELFDVPSGFEVTIKSSDASILDVKQTSGTTCDFTGISTGNAKIQIRIREQGFLFAKKKYNLNCKISVTPPAVSVKFRKKSYTIAPGKSKQISVTLRPCITQEKPTFESTNLKVASVSPAGKVRAKALGKCQIIARISNGKTAKCKIIVKKAKKAKQQTKAKHT